MHYKDSVQLHVPKGRNSNIQSCSHHFLCIVLYCFVAVFAAFTKSFEGSHSMQESTFASLICIIDERVPLASKLDRLGVLFCLMSEKNFLLLHCYGGLPKPIWPHLTIVGT